MKNMKIYTAILSLFLLSLCACKDLYNEPERDDKEEKVLLHIGIESIPDTVVRSVLPVVTLGDITRYELWGDAGSGEIELASFTSISGATAAVEKGTWTFTLKAFSGNTVLLQGQIPNRVINSSGNTLNFTLKPLSGVGVIHIVINFPADAGIVSAAAISGETEEALVINGNSALYDKSGVSSGEYFISFHLKDSNGTTLVVYSELILVGANLTSEKTVTLTEQDLKFRLFMPANLQATPLDTIMQLSWSAVAGASEYNVYRSDTEDGNFAFIGSSTGLSYTDSNVVAEAVYYYKFSVMNSNNAESLQSYAVSGVIPLKISAFSFASPSAVGVINGTAISVTIPTIVNITSLVPSISHTGVNVSPDPAIPQDFTSPVPYMITAQNATTKTYAVTVNVADTSLAGALNWLAENAVSDGNYRIKLQGNETLSPQDLVFSGKSNITITLDGGAAVIGLDSMGSLFTVGSGVTLTLTGSITLTGRDSNNSSLITVNSGGVLNMNDGVKITNNASSADGGGVSVSGTFNMNGGEISGNSAGNGGGVYVADDGLFKKTGGVIFGSDTPDVSAALKNNATLSGFAVYAGTNKVRNFSADTAANIDSSKSGMLGGFEEAVVINVTSVLNEWDLLTQTITVESGTVTPFTANGAYSTYQWYLDGSLVGTDSTYTFSATGSKAEGIYELIVRVRDSAGEERSGRCRITVQKDRLFTAAPIEIVLNLPGDWNLLPQIQELAKNTVTPFAVSGTYSAYQWYLNGIPVDTSSSYSFDTAGKLGGEVYELMVMVINSAGEQRAGRCRINIIKDPVPENEKPQTGLITISLNLPGEWDLLPQTQEVARDTVTQFTVGGTYSAYQWYLDGSPVGTDAIYSFDPAGKLGGEVYELTVAVGAGEQRAGRCKINIIKDPVPENEKPQTAVITISLNLPGEWDLLPQTQEVARDAVTQFTVDGTYSAYQWYLDGSQVGAGSSYSFDTTGKQGGEVYELSIVVTGTGQRSGRCRITIQN
jgi:hypothetical protein